MRLSIVEHGHGFWSRLQMRLMGWMLRAPAPDVIKIVLYRPSFFGRKYARAVHAALRGPSEWSVGERELMGAFVAAQNHCRF